jgi:hypothetical protein
MSDRSFEATEAMEALEDEVDEDESLWQITSFLPEPLDVL